MTAQEQSVPRFLRLFSTEVQNFLRDDGNIEEADNFEMISNWFEAFDASRILLEDRTERIDAFSNFLLQQQDTFSSNQVSLVLLY